MYFASEPHLESTPEEDEWLISALGRSVQLEVPRRIFLRRNTCMTSSAALAGGVAGVAEALVTMPFEVTKTRLQLGQGPPTILGSMADTVRTAGPSGLWYGLQPQVLQVAGKAAIRFSAFDYASTQGASPLVAGGFAGLTEALVWVAPTERLKLLRQSELGGAAGTGGGASVARSARAVLLAGGPAALWLGALPTAIRQTLANAVRFFVYDRARRHVPDGVPAPAAVAGACTGCVSVLLTNPVDVVKTRVQAAPLQSGGAASSVEVVRNLLRDEGLQALGKGLGARLLKIGLGQAIIFGTYDAVRKRMPRDG